MAIFINMFVLLFLTVVIGYKLASVRIRGSSLGAAMVLFTGILISFLVGTYINSLPDESTLKATGQALMDNSIVPSSVLSVFLVFFISGVGPVSYTHLCTSLIHVLVSKRKTSALRSIGHLPLWVLPSFRFLSV